ncbi:zinc-binding alcohol dehydrogenase [Microbacterium sp. Marseille-Q6965]|uniref:zinc-binding alcohol dehydrogenase n=1 Tax=Microbacterium sp. Marseille-Q6965 TaxID=2965072 RepID=UPI0021B758DB|nr:zinc-binding alcohol dehydrogenase [Microbacterium sp. Marseille-Q6965]
MQRGEAPTWQVTESTDLGVLIALYLRGALGVRTPEQLPPLRGVPAGGPASDELAAQWLRYWEMTVEPLAHPAGAPLELVPGFETHVALPAEAAALRRAIEPLAAPALAYADAAHERQRLEQRGRVNDLTWPHAVRTEERRIGRAAHPFVLNVQILPFAQRGIWRLGELTIAVSDGLRGDVAAFGSAIRPIVADLL